MNYEEIYLSGMRYKIGDLKSKFAAELFEIKKDRFKHVELGRNKPIDDLL